MHIRVGQRCDQDVHDGKRARDKNAEASSKTHQSSVDWHCCEQQKCASWYDSTDGVAKCAIEEQPEQRQKRQRRTHYNCQSTECSQSAADTPSPVRAHFLGILEKVSLLRGPQLLTILRCRQAFFLERNTRCIKVALERTDLFGASRSVSTQGPSWPSMMSGAVGRVGGEPR
eukprot:7389502-Prymnesium_polylepis.1